MLLLEEIQKIAEEQQDSQSEAVDLARPLPEEKLTFRKNRSEEQNEPPLTLNALEDWLFKADTPKSKAPSQIEEEIEEEALAAQPEAPNKIKEEVKSSESEDEDDEAPIKQSKDIL